MGSMGEVDVPTSLFIGISSFMRAASQVEALNPRVAYLCRLHGLKKAERLDPTSSGHGVPEFKTALLQRLERDDLQTHEGRVHSSDAREMLYFYREYNSKFVQALRTASVTGEDGRSTTSDHLTMHEIAFIEKMYWTATALFEVLNGLFSRVDDQEHELNKTREAVPGLRRRRRGSSQEHVVTRDAGPGSAARRGGGGSKPKQS